MRKSAGGKETERMLRNMRSPEPDEYRRRLAVNRAVAEYTAMPVRARLPFPMKLYHQAQYINPMTWFMQLGMFLLTVWMLHESSGLEQIYLIELSAVAPLFGIIGIAEVARSFSCQMWELENVCRYNLRSIISMKMLIIGLADLILFGLLSGIGIRTGGGFQETAFFILIPFQLSNMVYLGILMKTNGRCPVQLLAAAGIAMMGLASYFSGKVTEAESGPEYIIRTGAEGLLLLSFAGMVIMAVIFIRKCSWEDKRAWN